MVVVHKRDADCRLFTLDRSSESCGTCGKCVAAHDVIDLLADGEGEKATGEGKKDRGASAASTSSSATATASSSPHALPGPHVLAARAAWQCIRRVRALGYSSPSSPLESNLLRHHSRILADLQTLTVAAQKAKVGGRWGEKMLPHVQSAIAALDRIVGESTAGPDSGSSSSSSSSVATAGTSGSHQGPNASTAARDTEKACQALVFAAAVDAAYMEIFVWDAGGGLSSSRTGSGFACIPPPHIYLRSILGEAEPRGGSFTVAASAAVAAEAAAEAAAQAAAASSSSSSSSAFPLYPSQGLGCGRFSNNPLLEYMTLREKEAKGPLDLRRLSCHAFALQGPSPGKYEGTLRGTDPIACDAIRGWWDASRDRVAAWAAFACPDEASCEALRAFIVAVGAKGLVEAGAGTGYWAYHLRGLWTDVEVLAYDVRPPPSAKGLSGSSSGGSNNNGGSHMAAVQNEYHGTLPRWSDVKPGDAVVAANSHPRHTLFLCYPPPNNDSMALAALDAYAKAGGKSFALVGEIRGDTGSAALEKRLASDWKLVSCHDLPNFGNTVACLALWSKKLVGEKVNSSASYSPSYSAAATGAPSSSSSLLSPSPSPVWPLMCIACGACPPLPQIAVASGGGKHHAERKGPLFGRDRLTRSVIVCSRACRQSSVCLEALEWHLAQRHLPPYSRESAVDKDGKKMKEEEKSELAFTWDGQEESLIWKFGALL
jgi:hypothetical protein